MTTELTSAGLSIDTFEETLDSIASDQRANIDNRLDQSTASPLGQLNRILARSITQSAEALQAVYAGMDPDTNAGDAQDRIAAITGSFRRAAAKASVTLDVDLDAGVYPAGSLVSNITGQPASRFENRDEITSAGGSNLAVFEAETAGAQLAPTGAAGLYSIAGPVAGWNSVDASTLGTPGTDIETDAAFRIRRTQEVQAPGSTSAPGMAADISALVTTDVTSVTVIENDSDVTVDGIPPHAIRAIVFGPSSPTASDDLAVGTQIFLSKAAGIGTNGTTSVTVTDSQGIDHIVNFTRPSDVSVPVTVDVGVDATTYTGDAEVVSVLTSRIQELPPGHDVTWACIGEWVKEVTGVFRITSLSIDGAGITDRVILSTEKAQPGVITVTNTPGDP